MSAALLCTKCQAAIVADLAGLDDAGRVLCAECYLADPPAADVDGVFAEVAAHMEPPPAPTKLRRQRKPRAPKPSPEAKAELLTALGQALGCLPVDNALPKTGPQVAKATPHAKADPESKLPECCWYTGPLSELGPAEPRPPIISLAPLTRMDLEAREIAEQGRADLIRFFQMKAAFKARKAQVPAC